MQNGAELFVRTMAELDISQIFTLVGDHLNEVLLEASRAGIRIVDMRHESGVTHAADGSVHYTPRYGAVPGSSGFAVLYPDMDKITTLAALPLNGSPGYAFKVAADAKAPAAKGGQ